MATTSAQPSSVFSVATEQAGSITHLFLVTLGIAAVIFLIVAGLIIFVSIKFRQRPGTGEPNQNPGNLKLEITWTVIPALILFVLAVLTARVMLQVNPPAGSRKPDIIVNAHQWWWEYRYPKSGVITANELHMPVNVNSLLEIKSADVIHSFWVPSFGSKKDAIPGHPNHLFLKPIRNGIYLGACAEFCGKDHSLMGIRVIVEPPKEFERWIKSQLKVPAEPTSETARRGERLFMGNTCMSCHRIAGTKAKGQIGPDLTHVADRQTLGAGVLDNNLNNLTHWIMNPQVFKPGCHMPNMHLSEKDAHDIATYLEELK